MALAKDHTIVNILLHHFNVKIIPASSELINYFRELMLLVKFAKEVPELKIKSVFGHAAEMNGLMLTFFNT